MPRPWTRGTFLPMTLNGPLGAGAAPAGWTCAAKPGSLWPWSVERGRDQLALLGDQLCPLGI